MIAPAVVDRGEFAPPAGVFLVGYVDAEPVATGGYRVVVPGSAAQPVVLARHVSAGYHVVAGFGHYADEPGARCFGKQL